MQRLLPFILCVMILVPGPSTLRAHAMDCGTSKLCCCHKMGAEMDPWVCGGERTQDRESSCGHCACAGSLPLQVFHRGPVELEPSPSRHPGRAPDAPGLPLVFDIMHPPEPHS